MGRNMFGPTRGVELMIVSRQQPSGSRFGSFGAVLGVGLQRRQRAPAVPALLAQDDRAVHDPSEDAAGLVEERPHEPGLSWSGWLNLHDRANPLEEAEQAERLLFDLECHPPVLVVHEPALDELP
jgi:hypothetical protein